MLHQNSYFFPENILKQQWKPGYCISLDITWVIIGDFLGIRRESRKEKPTHNLVWVKANHTILNSPAAMHVQDESIS